MAKLHEYQTFITVVEQQSLSRTARILNLSPSAVSKHLAGLEADLGVKLIDRSTRSLAVTDLGERFYQDCCQILKQVKDTEERIREASDQPLGKLNLSTPRVLMNPSFAHLMKRFTRSNPEIHINFSVSDGIEDLVHGAIDFAFRIGTLSDSRLTALVMAETRPVLCASPEFVSEHPDLNISRPDDEFVRQHLVIPTYLNLSEKARQLTSRLPVRSEAQSNTMDLSTNHTTDDAVGLYQMVKQGLGCAFILDLMVQEDLKSGALVELKPQFQLPAQQLYLIFHKREYQPKKMQAFIEFMKTNKGLLLSTSN